MDLSVQDWLIVVGALLIAGVLLDAYRRYRNESRNPIRMGRKPGFWKLGDGFRDEEGEARNSELPNGGGRVRPRDADAARGDARQARAEARVEPSLDLEQSSSRQAEDARASTSTAQSATRVAVPQPGSPATRTASKALPPADEQVSEVLVIHVRAHAAEGFAGEPLVRLFKACDVRFGPQSIFQRHEEEKGEGAVQFNVVNLTHPGTFEDGELLDFSSPGLSFFLSLPGPQRPLEAFDCMLETARAVARNLDGEMQDESHSVFTSQTAEHYRQRIRDYVYRSSLARH